MSDKVIKRIIGVVVLLMIVLVALPLILRSLNPPAANTNTVLSLNTSPTSTTTTEHPTTAPSDVQMQLALSANEQAPAQAVGSSGNPNTLNQAPNNNVTELPAIQDNHQVVTTSNPTAPAASAGVNTATAQSTQPSSSPATSLQTSAAAPADLPPTSFNDAANLTRQAPTTPSHSMPNANPTATVQSTSPPAGTLSAMELAAAQPKSPNQNVTKKASGHSAPVVALNSNARNWGQGNWIIQLGAFSNTTNAAKLVQKLQTKGYPAYAQPLALHTGQPLTRVVVGPVGQQQAQQMKLQLAEEMNLNGVLMRSFR